MREMEQNDDDMPWMLNFDVDRKADNDDDEPNEDIIEPAI
jgi:hypothetical protein